MSNISTPISSGGGGSGVTSITGNSGGALTGDVTIAGGSNITTSGAGSTLTLALANSPSVSGSLTAGTGITATTGNISASAGNLVLPSTNSAGTQGVITMVGTRILHRGASAGADSLYVGIAAGLTSATGVGNTGCGFHSLTTISTGTFNTAVGINTLSGVTTGSSNTAIGSLSLTLTTGDENTAIGSGVLNSITTGARNTAMGVAAGSGLTSTESNNIMIGNTGTAGDNNIIRIGTFGSGIRQQNQCFIAAIRDITTTNNDAIAVLIDSAGQLGTVSSSARYKENVVPMGSDTDRLMNLRPVTFNMISDESKSKRYGLIAEEVALVFPELVVYKDGQPETVKYHDLAVMLLNEFQKLKKQMENK